MLSEEQLREIEGAEPCWAKERRCVLALLEEEEQACRARAVKELPFAVPSLMRLRHRIADRPERPFNPVPQLLAMVRELQREVDEAELAYRLLWQDASAWRGAIRRHRDARGHDRCWEGDLELYRALGEPLPEGPGLPCREEFLAKCAEYYEQQAKESRDG